MALRVLDIIVSKHREKEVVGLLRERKLAPYSLDAGEARVDIRVVVDADKTEEITDDLSERLEEEEGFHILVADLEAVVPKKAEEKKEEEAAKKKQPSRISREELVEKISTGAEFGLVAAVLVALSVIVASTGMLESNGAMIIGAMVIAPLLGPIMAISLATTLASRDLATKGLVALLVGVGTALVLSILLGAVLHVDPALPELALRTRVSLLDLAVAIASGVAGALFFTQGLAAALIGVMVAVALLPPLAAAGLLFGSGYYDLGVKALMLFVMNVIAINLAGVLTFAAQGVQPRYWWEESKAKRMTWIAIMAWAILVVVLAIVIAFVT